MADKVYFAIDLKSFYASVECISRGLDPLSTNLVVADESRTAKTICLAVSPSLKSFGIPGRPRLFEVIRDVKNANIQRKSRFNGEFRDRSVDYNRLKKELDVEIDYIVARPRMAKYIEVSTQIYEVYLKWVKPEDIHVYSIDEVFVDATGYLKLYDMDAEEMISKMILDVYNTTGITATGGVGTNLYLAKVAMDILAKHRVANEHGVRIAILDEMSYRKELWSHMPITDFWRVGKGYRDRLKKLGIFTMGDVARFSLSDMDRLYKEFGVNAELLIDHAWGVEPCTISDIKSYKPEYKSMSSGQVLKEPTVFSEALLVMKEMAESLSYDLVSGGYVTDKIVITVGYDSFSLKEPGFLYSGEIKKDAYGRDVPKAAHGTITLDFKTSSTKIIREKAEELFRKIVDRNLYVRRMYIVADKVLKREDINEDVSINQMNMFENLENKKSLNERLVKEEKVQRAVLDIKKKFGKNSILKGMNLLKGATAKERNEEIGGHRS